MKRALVQLDAGPDKDKNIRRALSFVKEAVERKAQFILLPEVFNYRGDLANSANFDAVAEKIPGDSLKPARSLNVRQPREKLITRPS